MDDASIDRMARLLGAVGTRRAALGILLGAGAVGTRNAAAKPTPRAAPTGDVKRKHDPLARLRDCPNPGPGQNLRTCNFVNKDLRGANLAGANLRGAVLANANLCGANLSGAKLGRADFTFAVLTRADLRETNLRTATFDHATLCRTQMPNGTLDDSHCPRDASDICCSDADCGAGVACERGWCGGRPPQAGACTAMGDVCTAGASPGCCHYAGPRQPVCDSTWAIVLTTCQLKCDGDFDCRKSLGSPDVFCNAGANCFPFDKCCFRKQTRNPKECSSGTSCLISQTVHECCLSSDKMCSVVGFGCV